MKTREERLADILASVERMAGGEVDHRIELSAEHDTLDALAFAINVMVGELSYGAIQLATAKEEAERRSAELAFAHENLLAKDRLATLGKLFHSLPREPGVAVIDDQWSGGKVLGSHMPMRLQVSQDECKYRRLALSLHVQPAQGQLR